LDKPGSRRNGRFSENIFFDAALALNFAGSQSHRVEAFRRHKSSAWCPGGTFFLNQSRVCAVFGRAHPQHLFGTVELLVICLFMRSELPHDQHTLAQL
jgi:hypothetical protein